MTADAIIALKAGPELDALVGTTMLGLTKRFCCPRCGEDWFHADPVSGAVWCTCDYGCHVWRGTWDDVAWQEFSLDSDAALAVLEHLAGSASVLVRRDGPEVGPHRPWMVQLGKGGACLREACGWDASLPVAVCKAVLLAAGEG